MTATITTAAELDALPRGAVVLDCGGNAHQKGYPGDWFAPGDMQRSTSGLLAECFGPLALLHRPDSPPTDPEQSDQPSEHPHALHGVGDDNAHCTCGASVTIDPQPGFSDSWSALMDWHAHHIETMTTAADQPDILMDAVEPAERVVAVSEPYTPSESEMLTAWTHWSHRNCGATAYHADVHADGSVTGPLPEFKRFLAQIRADTAERIEMAIRAQEKEARRGPYRAGIRHAVYTAARIRWGEQP